MNPTPNAPAWRGPLRARGWLLALLLGLCVPIMVAAQTTDAPVGTIVKVANTDGQKLNLRESPSQGAAVVAEVDEGTSLQVVGPDKQAEGLRWLNVKEPGGKVGWASADFLTVVATPTPAATAAATTAAAAMPSATPETVAQATAVPTAAPPPASESPEGTEATGKLEVDARVKFPETADREQVLTVKVSRGGAAVSKVQVMAVVQNTDPPIVRTFDPTDGEGRTTKTFDIRKEKGTVVIVVVAVSPDGDKGWQSVSYFKR